MLQNDDLGTYKHIKDKEHVGFVLHGLLTSQILALIV